MDPMRHFPTQSSYVPHKNKHKVTIFSIIKHNPLQRCFTLQCPTMASLNPLVTLFLSYLLLTLLLSEAKHTTSSKSTKIGQGYRVISIQDDPNGAITGLLQVKEKNNI